MQRLAFKSMIIAAVVVAVAVFSIQARGSVATRTTAVVLAVRKVGPAVVNISTTRRISAPWISTGDELLDRFFREFFQLPSATQNVLGSGVIIDPSGIIVTNYHVVRAAGPIRVQLADARSFTARVVGAAAGTDLALLKISARKPLPFAPLASRDDLMIGETVIAIGNPFGLEHTVTVGVVSAVDRGVPVGQGRWLSGLIQTDASINPGNSGGPLVNTDGEVVGINTAIFQRAQGIGFAIPASRVRLVRRELRRYGFVRPAWLGLGLQELTPQLAFHLGLGRLRGLVVTSVAEGGPGGRAGISKGEVLVGAGGLRLRSLGDLGRVMAGCVPGMKLGIVVGGRRGIRRVRVELRPYTLAMAKAFVWQRLGMAVKKGRGMVAVSRLLPGGRAARAGIMVGDRILAVGGRRVSTPAGFYFSVVRARFRGMVGMVVGRGGMQGQVELGLRP